MNNLDFIVKVEVIYQDKEVMVVNDKEKRDKEKVFMDVLTKVVNDKDINNKIEVEHNHKDVIQNYFSYVNNFNTVDIKDEVEVNYTKVLEIEDNKNVTISQKAVVDIFVDIQVVNKVVIDNQNVNKINVIIEDKVEVSYLDEDKDINLVT